MNVKWLKIGGLITAIGAIGWYGYQQYLMTDNLCFNVVGYKIVSVGINGTRVDLTVSIKNLGKLDVKVNKMKVNVFSEGDRFIATAFSDQKFEIKPLETSKTKVQILVNPRLLMKNIGGVLGDATGAGSSWRNIPLTLDGGVSVSKMGIPFYIPFVTTYRLSDFIEEQDVEGIC